MNNTEVLNRPFDIETHKNTFINYLEVIILEDGTVEYAVPSHQAKLLMLYANKLNIPYTHWYDLDKDIIWKHVPQNDLPNLYLMAQTNTVCVYTAMVEYCSINKIQKEILQQLKDAELYRGEIPE